ncbi:polysaccharide deacetylase family protein, partial [Streptomyces sp. NPDC059082]
MPRLRLRRAPRAALAALVPLALLGAVAGPAHAAPAAWPEPVPGGAPVGHPRPGGLLTPDGRRDPHPAAAARRRLPRGPPARVLDP